MINEKTITLLSVAWGDELEKIKSILDHCNNIFPYFDSTILISNIDNLFDYNKFFIEDLHLKINTDFVLTVQSDGFIINPNLWNNNFLNYDYIGAPWPWHKVCGNGGFSLRSKKLLEVSSKLKYKKDHPEYDLCPEDSFICLDYFNRVFMVKNGIKFAPIHVALNFSFEHPISEYPNHTIKNSFGFHGKFNL